MVSQCVDEFTPLRLVDVLRNIGQFDSALTAYVASGEPVQLSTAVMLVDEEEEDPPKGMSYLLEVHLIREVLQVWKRWRENREPTLAEACAAISYYASRDAHQPIDED